MINKNLICKNNIPCEFIDKNKRNLFQKRFSKIFKNFKFELNNPKKTLNVLKDNFTFNFNQNELARFKKFKSIALVGMGGSILGSEAIKNFLDVKIKKKIYFFNNLNINQIIDFKKKEKLDKVLFIIISKSGNTVETLSNFFSLGIIKKKSKNIIIITEKKESALFNLAKKLKLHFVEHNPNIGGRYSVLSEVGILPAYLMGINIRKLRKNILNFMIKDNLNFLQESTIKLSCLMNSKKIKNIIFLNYSPEMEKFLLWCQQLIAESLGKKGKGFFPVISSVPKDHHSLLQLYLDGPKDKIFHIFSLKEKSSIKLNIKKFKIKNFLDKKNIHKIKDAQKDALIKTLNENQIPFREFRIKNLSEETLGELFAYFIMETILIGKMNLINPFNQPAVEQVKIYTKKLLS